VEAKDLYPKLETFIGGYFNQNWFDFVPRGEANREDYIVRDMLRRESRAILLDLTEEISRLLASGVSEADLRRIIKYEFVGHIDPVLDGSTFRAWLEHVKERIDEHLKFSLR